MEIKFLTSKRDDNVALWVNWGEGNWNIWDIPESCATPSVLNAIVSAFQLGMQAQSFNVSKVLGTECCDLEKWGVRKDV